MPRARYTYDHWDVIHETRLNDTQVTRFITGLGVDQPLRMIRANGLAYTFHADGLGSISFLTNSSGGVVETYSYDAFGQVTIRSAFFSVIATSGVGNEHFYTARRLDPLTEFYEYRHRDYDPATGRFLQPDPLGYIDGPNMYAYVLNSPISFVDPLGLGSTLSDPRSQMLLAEMARVSGGGCSPRLLQAQRELVPRLRLLRCQAIKPSQNHRRLTCHCHPKFLQPHKCNPMKEHRNLVLILVGVQLRPAQLQQAAIRHKISRFRVTTLASLKTPELTPMTSREVKMQAKEIYTKIVKVTYM